MSTQTIVIESIALEVGQHTFIGGAQYKVTRILDRMHVEAVVVTR